MTDTTRRAFLRAIPAVATTSLTPAAAIAAQPVEATTAQEDIDRAFEALAAAMKRFHGDGCIASRNENRILYVMEPVRPRIVEFQGPGRYEIEADGKQPLFYVERAPQFDHRIDGRCFKATPEVKRLGTRYYYEGYLRTILIRKLPEVLS